MEYRYGKYQNINQETRWATEDEIKRSSTHINLYDDTYPGAGIPIMSDGHEAYVDSADTKNRGETLIIHSRQYPVITEIADIDSYEMFKGYDALPLVNYEMPESKIFDLDQFFLDVINEDRPLPFS